MRKVTFLMFVFLFSLSSSFAGVVKRVEPLNWWVGMKNPNVQLLIYGNDISGLSPELNYPGVTITGVERTANKNYLFVNLTIAPETMPGVMEIRLTGNNKVGEKIRYELKARGEGSSLRNGFDSGDLMYLVLPDRFSNGDSKNDIVKGYSDKTDRQAPGTRHGGDIQGVINHLDYISDMGYTALWLNPVQENNMQQNSYHGYAITDFYHIDPRHGNNALYQKLSDECRKRGIKLVMDIILNHCGTEWWIYKDLPANDWINNYPNVKICSFRGTTNFDPHRADIDQKAMTDGWFAHSMPDLNQRNPLVANYLIQNSIWWVEYAGLGGLRSDTHQYPDKNFVSEWSKRILAEYPKFNMVGEVWLTYPSMTAYWQKDALNRDGYNSNLPTVMDFPLQFALRRAFSEGEGWETGMARLYDLLSQDFLFANPMSIMVFADNHDTSRLFTLLDENLPNYKLAMALLLTTRGIPQMYAGTEVLQTGNDSDHGVMRKDFPGGWPSDRVNAFTQAGLTPDQIDAQNYMKLIQNWRKGNNAVKYGTMKQYVPENGVYVYFRSHEDKSVMVIINNNPEKQSLQTARFMESLKGYNTGKDIISGKNIAIGDQMEVEGKTAMIIELK